ncbi:MAG: cell division protein ZipA [Nitrincola lacisaponensis]|uniref:cell division protein ZipA n=1 Tax=Nitrincola lacisaponensis TaxID=267850 RepID=UPI0039197D5E
MEISLREWLIIGGILVIALILFDGWRRIRANRNRLRLDIDKTLSEISDTEHHNPELPNGGARVRSLSATPAFVPEAEPRFTSEINEPSLTAEDQAPPKPAVVVSEADPELDPPVEQAVEQAWRAEPDFDPVELQSSMLDDIGSAVEQPAVTGEKPWIAETYSGVRSEELTSEELSTEDHLAEMPPLVEDDVIVEAQAEAAFEPEYQNRFQSEEPEPEPEFKSEPAFEVESEVESEVEPESAPYLPEQVMDEPAVSPAAFQPVESEPLQETEEAPAEEESLEWDPALEQAFQLDEQPVRREPQEPSAVKKEPSAVKKEPSAVKKESSAIESEPSATSTRQPETTAQIDLSDLDPLFDDIPAMEFEPPVSAAASAVSEKDTEEPNLYLDLDLEQPIHQIMANKAAANKAAGREVTRRSAEKTRRRPTENPSFTLPLDTQHQDLFAVDESFVEEPFVEEQPDLPAPSVEAPPVAPTAPVKPAASEASRTAASAARKALTDLPDPDEVLVITVVGKDRQTLPGERLRRVVEACGMEYGDMSIFHRFEGEGIPSSLQFSMANAVNPGTFDLSTMGELETPAVSFFMSMREPRDPMTAYECMLATAETVAKNLNGDLLDEDRSVMREQTKEHYRQRIRDFEMQSRRRKLSR